MLGLSKLASALGRPIHVDSMTKDRKTLGFARICIEMYVSSSFPSFIELYQGIDEFLGEPKIARLMVEYQWLPSVCKQCQVFGHKDSLCPRKPPSPSPPASVSPVPPPNVDQKIRESVSQDPPPSSASIQVPCVSPSFPKSPSD